MRCLIACGGNVGDVPQTLSQATALLANHPSVSSAHLSRLFRTVPVGANAGGVFWNAVILLETTLEPHALLDEILQVEQQLGRLRTARWGPRTLDLDIAFYGQEVIQSARLTVPHPAIWWRRFVLDPLVDIAPDWPHPVLGSSLSALLGRLAQRPLPVGLWLPEPDDQLVAKLSQHFPEVQLHARLTSDWSPTADDTEPESHIALQLWFEQPDQPLVDSGAATSADSGTGCGTGCGTPPAQPSSDRPLFTAHDRMVVLTVPTAERWQSAVDVLTAALDRPIPV